MRCVLLQITVQRADSRLWGGLGVALGYPWGGFRVALYSTVDGFGVALYSRVYAEYMPSIWLCGGFRWLWVDLSALGRGRPGPRLPSLRSVTLQTPHPHSGRPTASEIGEMPEGMRWFCEQTGGNPQAGHYIADWCCPIPIRARREISKRRPVSAMRGKPHACRMLRRPLSITTGRQRIFASG